MADQRGGESSVAGGKRREMLDPAHNLDGKLGQDNEGPRVQFSQDSVRGIPTTPASSEDIPNESTPTVPARTNVVRGFGSAAPATKRTRDRGYSLRRALFTSRITTLSDTNSIELDEAGPSEPFERVVDAVDDTADVGKGKQKNASISIAPVQENDQDIYPVKSSPPRTNSEVSKEKKRFGTLTLPNYESWARKQKQESALWRKIAERWDHIRNLQELPPSVDGRHINLDTSRQTQLIDERRGAPYIGNSIRSSRYTLVNFFPRQLVFQFSKLANAYFLGISILQMIPAWSTIGNTTAVIPLALFVCISMAKEAYDDIRRYDLDQIENNRQTLVFQAGLERKAKPQGPDSEGWATKARSKIAEARGHHPIPSNDMAFTIPISEGESETWIPVKWRDIRVGDVIKLRRDEPIPADIILLHSNGPNGIAFIETMALDGETNLKTKQAPACLAKQCGSDAELLAARATIVSEDPNINLYSFNGRVIVNDETLPLTTNEIVFRGSTLRNTKSAIGMVINSGEECKIRMNANKNPRAKAPAIQAITNKIILMLVLFVVILSLFCTIAYQVWTENFEEKAWYLKGAHVIFVQIIVGFIILFNTVIPLSLYVSLEIIKVFQLILMGDIEMYDPVSNTPMICNTTTILENLGQVDYIFSDKTGTLTDNVMKFRKLSVAGYAWLHDIDLQKEAAKEDELKAAMEETESKGKAVASKFSSKKSLGLPNGSNDAISIGNSARLPASVRRSSSVVWKSTARPSKVQPEMRTEDLLKLFLHKPHSVFTKKARFFLLSMALCHTCIPETQADGTLTFQAASPDELALVQAAQDLGWLVIDRPANLITVRYPAGSDSDEVTEVYEILDVIEFSSKRKRMSIIVRFPNGKICVFCKGADSAIMPRLKLAALANQKKSEVFRRSSVRKSMEAEQAMRRMSEHSPRTSLSLNRGSMSLSRKSIGHGRPSMTGSRLQPIRDELDSWLRGREHDVEGSLPDDTIAYRTPRQSMGGLSFASSGRGDSDLDEGFDDIIDEALVLDDAAVFARCFQHIDDFATEGLRTLLFAYRFLDEQEYALWKKIYLEATTSLVDRQKLIENAGEIIEQNFDLAGATAIEDKLQKGVPETIDKLRRANIKMWMLTGDKRETAINIAHSARICKNYSEVIILDHTTREVEQRMAAALLDLSKGQIAHCVIVVDGQTLSEIDANVTLAILFLDIAVLADSVICCRASPSQKASLVKRVKSKIGDSITLAIGDGANDIAMIQEAHVGVGISGKEGLQAARISDYSIAQFRFLQKLLLVHGRWNYVRTGKYILATFWKELMFYLVQALYQKWNGYTGTSLFEATSLTVFNTLFTSLPVIFLGILDQDLNASTLLAVPELYTIGQRHEGFNLRKYVGWMFMAVCEAMIIYFTMYGLFGSVLWTVDDDLLAMGTLCFTAAVIFINTKLLVLEKHNKTVLTVVAYSLSVGGWFVWQLFLSGAAVSNKKFWHLYPMKGDFIKGFGKNALWWLVLILTISALTVFELGVQSVRKAYWPSETDLFQELQNDAIIRARFEDTIRKEAAGESLEDVQMGRETLESDADERREGEIQELLERPRIMVTTGLDGEGVDDVEVVRSPIEIGDGEGVGGVAGSMLKKRKISVDLHLAGNGELRTKGVGLFAGPAESDHGDSTTNVPKTRHSIDVAELLGMHTKREHQP